MTSTTLDQRINSFLSRKDAEFPELALVGHENASKTVKYEKHQLAFGR